MKNFKKIVVTVLAGAMLMTAFAGCKKKPKTLSDAIADQAESVGAQTVEFSELEDFTADMEAEDLEDGLYFEITSDDIADLDVPREASMIIDVDDIDTVRVYVRATLDEDSPADSGAAVVAVIKFNEEENAVDFFDNIYSYRSFLDMVGLNPDDLSDDELYFDEDEAEGGLVINIVPTAIFESLLNSMDIDQDMIDDANVDLNDIPRVVFSLRLHDDSVIISLSFSDDYTAEVDGIYTAAGIEAPSEVESSDAVVDFISNMLVANITQYIERAQAAAGAVDAHNADVQSIIDQIDGAAG